MKWKKSPIDAVVVKQLAQRYGISLLQASVLVRRGVTNGQEILFFLEHDFIYLHQPYAFRDMEIAVDRIKEAQQGKECVFIYGDKDVDGITSTAILVRTLRDLNIETIWCVPLGILGYGLSNDDIDYAKSNNATLIITVDCGISNNKECDYANELGIDVIILDHHMPNTTLPNAVAIIDAKIEAQKYPFDGLCAAAVAQKFRLALAISETPLYNVDQVLMNIIPISGGYKFELLCLRNMVIQWRKSIITSPKSVEFQLDEIMALLEGRYIIVFDQKIQVQLLQQALGSVELYSVDLQSLVNKYFVTLKDKTLLSIGESVRLSKYFDREFEEIDVFFQLYKAAMYAEFPELKRSFYSVSDLVVLATLADMMPLHGENRILYKIGIEQINTHVDQNLSILLSHLKITSGSIDSRTIGWRIAPIINSAGRMGKADIAVQMLLAENTTQATSYAQELCSLNQQRRKQMDVLRIQLKEEVEKSLEKYKTFVLVYNESLPHSFTGLVAGQYFRQYGVPVVIVANRDTEMISGSIRCPAQFNAPVVIRMLESYLIDGGGHKAAAGFSVPARQKEDFLIELSELLAKQTDSYSVEDSTHTIDIDLEVPDSYFKPKDIKMLHGIFEPYGEGWATINILFPYLKIDSCETVGQGNEHIKFVLQIGSYKVSAFLWQYSESNVLLEDMMKAILISIVAHAKSDYYQGVEQLSLIIQDWNIEK